MLASVLEEEGEFTVTVTSLLLVEREVTQATLLVSVKATTLPLASVDEEYVFELVPTLLPFTVH